MSRWVVAGGGIKGIAAAVELARRDHDVTLVEANPYLGGILHSREWDAFFVDNGCHLLDFSHADSGRFFQSILGDEMHPVSRRYASINRGKASDGIAVPDMSGFDKAEKAAALTDIVAASSTETSLKDRNLSEALRERFGQSAGDYMAACARKMTAVDPNELSSLALQTLPMLGRIRIGDDAKMAALKKEPALDARLAVSSQSNPMQFASADNPFKDRNQYPSRKGMAGFCEAALGYLRGIGCSVLVGSPIARIDETGPALEFWLGENDQTKLEADYCFWCLPPARLFPLIGREDPARGTQRPVSLINFAFRVSAEQVTDMTYVHDFSSESMAFRHSTPGKYGKQSTADGHTYVCVEVPCSQADTVWTDPLSFSSRLWDEAVHAGIVTKGAAHHAVRDFKIPVGMMLPLRSSESKLQERARALQKYANRFIFGDAGAFGKSAIVDAVRADIDQFCN